MPVTAVELKRSAEILLSIDMRIWGNYGLQQTAVMSDPDLNKRSIQSRA